MGLNVPLGDSYAAESAALFARMTTPPTTARKSAIDTCIRALKAGGVWDKCEGLYFFAATDAQAALLNWKGATYNCAVTNAPTFTADRGYTGNGSNAFISPTGVLENALSLYAQNSAHMSGWARNELNGSGNICGFNNNAFINPRSSGSMVGRANDAANLAVVQASSVGLSTINRSGAAARQLYRNGAAIGNDTQASAALAANGFTFLVHGTGGGFSAYQVAAGSFGASLTAGEELAKYNAILAYLQAVGAA